MIVKIVFYFYSNLQFLEPIIIKIKYVNLRAYVSTIQIIAQMKRYKQ